MPAGRGGVDDEQHLPAVLRQRVGRAVRGGGGEVVDRRHRDAGLVVLGFPCNQFGAQEPGDAAEIARFCT
jgi:hypothetical protein